MSHTASHESGTDEEIGKTNHKPACWTLSKRHPKRIALILLFVVLAVPATTVSVVLTRPKGQSK